MSIENDIPQIAVLRERVESCFGKRLQVHADFLALVADIEAAQRQHISESTLERVWGYSTRGYGRVSLRTLDVLAKYAGSADWRDFCAELRQTGVVESEMFLCGSVRSSDLHVGDRLRIGWQPDRVCTVRYLGDNRFVAEACENSKMRAGATFSCLQFQLGRELVMDDFVNGDVAEQRIIEPPTTTPVAQSTDIACNTVVRPQRYAVGSRHGLTLLEILR